MVVRSNQINIGQLDHIVNVFPKHFSAETSRLYIYNAATTSEYRLRGIYIIYSYIPVSALLFF